MPPRPKPTFIPSTPADLPRPSPAEACLQNVLYLRQAVAVLERELLGGTIPSTFVVTRVFEAARAAGTAVAAIKPTIRDSEPPCT